MPSPTDGLFNQVGQIAALATICEVRMRILADNTPSLTHVAHANRLEDVENAIFKAFGKHFAPKEIEQLRVGRVIRNKVLHGNFEAASIKLSEIAGEALVEPSGFALDIASGETRTIGSKSLKSSSIFEWLLAIGTTGFFPVAADILQKNLLTLDRIIEQSANGEIEPELLNPRYLISKMRIRSWF